MGWQQTFNRMEAAQRRSERASVKHYRELQRQYKEMAKQEEKLRAANQVARFESYLELIVSLHKDVGPSWDWESLSRLSAPKPPLRSATREGEVDARKAAYAPGFFARLFGGDKKQMVLFERSLVEARQADEADHHQALERHAAEVRVWEVRSRIGSAIVAQTPSAYADALDQADAFGEFVEFGMKVSVIEVAPDAVALNCEIVDPELVPTEEVKLTAAGKLSTKEMPQGRYWPLFQDYVCSASLRIARETFAALPIPRVVVNMGRFQTNTSTGHSEFAVLLAVHFVRAKVSSIKLDSIDPSDSLKNFSHRMKFKKTSGFEQVEPITLLEQWVTTG